MMNHLFKQPIIHKVTMNGITHFMFGCNISNIENGVWFQIGMLKNKHGKILRWLYDTWYEIQEDETGMIYYVYPEHILS